MTDDSLEILWRGADPAKFTALQAALRDDGIQFWHAQVYDPAGGFLSSRPYYLEAVPGFEIRVHACDIPRANDALEWVEGKEDVPTAPGDPSKFDHSRSAPKQSLPYDWDSSEATSEAWVGEDEPMHVVVRLGEDGFEQHHLLVHFFWASFFARSRKRFICRTRSRSTSSGFFSSSHSTSSSAPVRSPLW